MLPPPLSEIDPRTIVLVLLGLMVLLGIWNIWLLARVKTLLQLRGPTHNLLDDRIASRLAEKDLPCDERVDARVRDLLLDRMAYIFAHPDQHDFWMEKIDARLGERICARAVETAPQVDQRIDNALKGRLETIFDHPDHFEDLFESVDEKLTEAVQHRIEVLTSSPAGEESLEGFVREQLVARVEGMFEYLEDNESLCESIDETLQDRIVHVASNLPEEASERMNAVIHEALVSQVEAIFENAENYESLFETIDEKLGERIVRQVEHPPLELKERLDEPVRNGLSSRVEAFFANPDAYEDLLEQVDEQLSRRVERRLREELARGPDGLIEQLIVEALRTRVQQRLAEDGRHETLELAIDNRIKGRTGNEGRE